MTTHHHHEGSCCACGISRRGFLAASGAAAASLTGCATSTTAVITPGPGELGEYIDLASFRPKPKVKIMSVVVREKPPYWLGWPGASYDVEGQRKEYEQAFADAAEKVGVELVQEPVPLENQDAVLAYINKLKAEKPQAVLVTFQHMSSQLWVNMIRKAGFPTIIFSPIGTLFTHQDVADISYLPGVHLVSSINPWDVEQSFRMIRAKHQLEQTSLLVVAGDNEHSRKFGNIGTTVHYVPRSSYHELFAKMPVTPEVVQVAKEMARHAKTIVEPNKDDILNAARSYITAKQLMRSHGANAITTDCLGMVSQRNVPTPPCMAATIFQDGGVTYGCEADLNAAMSLLFVSYLFDKPGFQQDPYPLTVENELGVAHCTCGTRLNGFDQPPVPYCLRNHSESALGVATQVLWREGQPVSLVLFRGPDELIIDTGTVTHNIETPPAGGCRTHFAIEMDRMEDARDALGFHQVVFYGNHRRDVEAYCQMFGLHVVNSPSTTPIKTPLVGMITTWNGIGPFDNKEGTGHKAVYPPENEINFDATYEGLDGPVKWKIITEPMAGDGYVDLLSHFNPNVWSVAYVMNYLYAVQPIDVELRIGSNDTLKVWLGGEMIWQYRQERGARPDEDIVKVSLKPGWTPVLLKVTQSENRWGFYFRVTDTAGNPTKKVKAALKPSATPPVLE